MGNKQTKQKSVSLDTDQEKEAMHSYTRLIGLLKNKEDNEKIQFIFDDFLRNTVEIKGKIINKNIERIRRSIRFCSEFNSQDEDDISYSQENLQKIGELIYFLSNHMMIHR